MGRQSFIEPRIKRAIDNDLKLLVIFAALTFVILVAIDGYYRYKIHDVSIKNAATLKAQNSLTQKREQAKSAIERIEVQRRIADEIRASNIVLKDSIKNFFDLIPDEITLEKAEVTGESLVLDGVTPSKELYDFTLLASLKSIFPETTTMFYPLKTGGYRFVSHNRLGKKSIFRGTLYE